jgi:hypothetical protein
VRRLGLAVVLFFTSRTAWADLYSFVDNDGVVHFTNIPNDPRYKPAPSGGNNTYEWQDEIGMLRRVHKVDITAYDELIITAARYYSLPPALIKAVVAVESAFEPSAISPAGAQGLMQLIPATASEMYVRDPFDARDNVYGGTRYLRILANRFNGNLRLVIAAYNAGPNLVDKQRDVPAIPETRRYVQRVLTLYHHYLESWRIERR